jgi:phosphoglycerol transferase MdoB-like AlkP superfamily enzyme
MTWRFYPAQSLIFLFSLLLSVIAIRGGIQAGPPISQITAANMVGTANVALATNTPFTIYRTIGKSYIREKPYFSAEALAERISPVHELDPARGPFDSKNVVIIVMESLSREYLARPVGNEGLTPFLDALIARGLFFTQAYANAKRSQDAIPSILASIPSLMENAYISSVYSSNNLESLASTLAQKGYHTSFFHGGQTGTMGFNYFCGAAGVQEYYGMAEYPDKNNFDGDWGIFDEPFFQFFAQKLDNTPQPFFALFFTLTSHHPYPLPEKYKPVFKEGKHPIFKTIQYADHALEKFFETAEKMAWYKDTLFVITADHTMYGQSPFYKSDLGKYAIPLLFFSPGDARLQGKDDVIVQQLDIMPTVLDYLNYDRPFFSLGESVFDASRKGFSISYNAGIYQYIQGRHLLHFDGEKSLALYDFENDRLQENNLIDSDAGVLEEIEDNCKAFIQTYNHALLNNKMTATAYK